MYAGKIVEAGTVNALFKDPAHPYTKALLKSIPDVEIKVDRLESIEGQPPELFNLPDGCRFAPRCSCAMDICKQEYPPLINIDENHSANCWLLVN
jgi:peptide/nickel transport system ATP-binding protein